MIRRAFMLTLGFLAGLSLPGTAVEAEDGDKAFELHCGEMVLIVQPAAALALADAKRIAECMGERVCTVSVIRVRRTK